MKYDEGMWSPLLRKSKCKWTRLRKYVFHKVKSFQFWEILKFSKYKLWQIVRNHPEASHVFNISPCVSSLLICCLLYHDIAYVMIFWTDVYGTQTYCTWIKEHGQGAQMQKRTVVRWTSNVLSVGGMKDFTVVTIFIIFHIFTKNLNYVVISHTTKNIPSSRLLKSARWWSWRTDANYKACRSQYVRAGDQSEEKWVRCDWAPAEKRRRYSHQKVRIVK